MRALPVMLAALMCAGCATVTRGTTSNVQFLSEPAGATVTTSLGHSCVTPCTLVIGRKEEFSATFALPGHEPQTIPVKTEVAGAGAAGFAGNVILGGVVGMAADAATGATLEHVPNPVSARLVPTHRAAPVTPRPTRPPRAPTS